MVEIYNRETAVRCAEANYIAQALWSPNDGYHRYQWHLNNSKYGGIRMELARNISTGSAVTVAIVDTGVAFEDYCTGSSG
jgi:serine protease